MLRSVFIHRVMSQQAEFSIKGQELRLEKRCATLCLHSQGLESGSRISALRSREWIKTRAVMLH